MFSNHKNTIKKKSVNAELDIKLLEAVMQGENVKVDQLLKKGARFSAYSMNGYYAIHWAAFNSNITIIQALIQAGDNPLKKVEGKSQTALFIAADYHYSALLAVLIETIADKESKNPLEKVISAGEDGILAVTRYLISQHHLHLIHPFFAEIKLNHLLKHVLIVLARSKKPIAKIIANQVGVFLLSNNADSLQFPNNDKRYLLALAFFTIARDYINAKKLKMQCYAYLLSIPQSIIPDSVTDISKEQINYLIQVKNILTYLSIQPSKSIGLHNELMDIYSVTDEVDKVYVVAQYLAQRGNRQAVTTLANLSKKMPKKAEELAVYVGMSYFWGIGGYEKSEINAFIHIHSALERSPNTTLSYLKRGGNSFAIVLLKKPIWCEQVDPVILKQLFDTNKIRNALPLYDQAEFLQYYLLSFPRNPWIRSSKFSQTVTEGIEKNKAMQLSMYWLIVNLLNGDVITPMTAKFAESVKEFSAEAVRKMVENFKQFSEQERKRVTNVLLAYQIILDSNIKQKKTFLSINEKRDFSVIANFIHFNDDLKHKNKCEKKLVKFYQESSLRDNPSLVFSPRGSAQESAKERREKPRLSLTKYNRYSTLNE